MVECEITNACNLRCIHCYNRSGDGPRKELAPYLIKELMLQLKGIGLRYFDMVGGEPFTYPWLFELLEFADRIGLRVIINTNGTLVTKEMALRLKEANPHSLIGVSLDGSCPQINDQIRGKESFLKAVKGAENLMEAGFNVTLLFVINKINWRDFERYVRFAREIGVRAIYVDRFMPVGRGKINEEKLNMSVEEWVEALEFINSVVEGSSRDIIFYIGESINGEPCTAGEEHFSILSDGTVVPCGHFRYESRFYLGNVKDEPIKKIFERGRKLFGKPAACIGCGEYGGGCFGGCRASAVAFAGKIDLPDPVICEYMRKTRRKP
jgi:radical SAM protein with 4Fe4S-binding SPASM domain